MPLVSQDEWLSTSIFFFCHWNWLQAYIYSDYKHLSIKWSQLNHTLITVQCMHFGNMRWYELVAGNSKSYIMSNIWCPLNFATRCVWPSPVFSKSWTTQGVVPQNGKGCAVFQPWNSYLVRLVLDINHCNENITFFLSWLTCTQPGKVSIIVYFDSCFWQNPECKERAWEEKPGRRGCL